MRLSANDGIQPAATTRVTDEEIARHRGPLDRHPGG